MKYKAEFAYRIVVLYTPGFVQFTSISGAYIMPRWFCVGHDVGSTGWRPDEVGTQPGIDELVVDIQGPGVYGDVSQPTVPVASHS